jgi:hypothetical protein
MRRQVCQVNQTFGDIGFTAAVISYKGGGAFGELKIQLRVGAEISER